MGKKPEQKKRGGLAPTLAYTPGSLHHCGFDFAGAELIVSEVAGLWTNKGRTASGTEVIYKLLCGQISVFALERLLVLSPGVIISIVIKTFKDKETEKIFRGYFSRKFSRGIQRLARASWNK